jgi:uncharacterized protein (TIGR02246 family)
MRLDFADLQDLTFRGETPMRVIVAVALAATAVLSVAAQTSRTAADENSIRDVVKNYVAARERADAGALAAIFTDDADQLVSSGEWRRGRDALVQGTLASSKGNAGARTIAIQTVRFPAADVAIADGEYTIAGTAGGAARKMWTSFVMVRGGGTWRITAIRNMLPASAP